MPAWLVVRRGCCAPTGRRDHWRGSRVHTRTTTQLLEDLRESGNADAWTRFDARYRPVLVGFARTLGFSPDDSAEVAQRTMVEFTRAYQSGRYERGQGRLSSWLIGIARNTAMSMRREGRRNRAVGGEAMQDAAEAVIGDEAHLTRIWAKERDSAVLAEAIRQLRGSPRMEAHTMRAFELFALRGMPAAEVAKECGIDVDSVYVIKNRLTKRLREIVRELTLAYEEGD